MKYLFVSILLFTSFSSIAQPPDAASVLKEAQEEAIKTNKSVFIIFHASWCIWCHRMDNAMDEPALKPLFERNYIIKHLTIDERAKRKNMENPGASIILAKYHGEGSGIPYWFILDKNGNLIADSRLVNDSGSRTQNVGCPTSVEEVNYFIDVLKKSSDLNAEELGVIRERFRKIASY